MVTQVRVITCEEPVWPSDDVYKVMSVPRGKVLILNYDQFEKAPFRSGAVWDGNTLGNLFTEVSYILLVTCITAHQDNTDYLLDCSLIH